MGVGPSGVSVGVLVGVFVAVGVGVLVGIVGVMEGSKGGFRVLVGSGSGVGTSDLGVQVGSSELGVLVGVREGTTAATAAVGAPAALVVSSVLTSPAKGVSSSKSGMKKTATNPATTSKATKRNRIAMTFWIIEPQPRRFFLSTFPLTFSYDSINRVMSADCHNPSSHVSKACCNIVYRILAFNGRSGSRSTVCTK